MAPAAQLGKVIAVYAAAILFVWTQAVLPAGTYPRTLFCKLQVSNTTLLKNYYTQAYATVRKYSSCFVALCPPESQVDGSEFQTFMNAPAYTKVIQDVHRRACGHVRIRACLPEFAPGALVPHVG